MVKRVPHIVGIDPSLTATGLASPTGVYVIKSGQRGTPRLIDIRERVEAHLLPAQLVVLEGYSYDSHHQGHQLGELGGVLRVLIHEMGIPVVVLTPGNRAIIATGSGRASKDEVFAAAIRRLGYDGNSKDAADALWLREAGLQAYGHGTVPLPQSHLRALDSVEWPKL